MFKKNHVFFHFDPMYCSTDPCHLAWLLQNPNHSQLLRLINADKIVPIIIALPFPLSIRSISTKTGSALIINLERRIRNFCLLLFFSVFFSYSFPFLFIWSLEFLLCCYHQLQFPESYSADGTSANTAVGRGILNF